jgi:ribose transport system ATP-binding protein/rhamnose transport system ATP-binding protein
MLRDIVADGVAVVVVSSAFEELLGLCHRIVVMREGRTIADLPSAMLDEEKLTLLAAPRTSMARNTELLDTLTREFDGAGFWTLIEEDRLICLNSVVKKASLDPGFGPGEARQLAQTLIPEALAKREPIFVAEPDRSRTTLLVPMRSARGHDLGWVGLSLSPDAKLPSPEMIKARIETMAATL